jgi:hypothetical protein
MIKSWRMVLPTVEMARTIAYRRKIVAYLGPIALVVLGGPLALAATPDSPEVKQIVDRALKYLESGDDARLGGQCLIGLAFHKAGRMADHPKIAAALKACEQRIGSNVGDEDNYSVGLALIFLLETNPEKNRSLASRYLTEVLRRQQRGGGWSYPSYETGDTSQTQYPTLGLWLAQNNGLQVPQSALERICGWLLRTQDPSGAWGYQGTDPGNYQRVNQNEIRPALAAAGLGSLYICANVLGVGESQPEKDENAMPPALRPVGSQQPAKKRVQSTIESRVLRKGLADGNTWFARNRSMESEGHTHYYLYAFERYQSFKEFAEGRSDPNPKWYDEIVAYLKRTQQPEGHWDSGDGQAVATSFAVITLLRGTKKTLATVSKNLGQGVLLGGRGLPKQTADLQERDGRIIESPLAGTIEELLKAIEKDDSGELAKLAESRGQWKLDSGVTKRSGEITRLRAIVSAGRYESRLIAVRALARIRELDNVPLLIYSLSDPDMRIVREADKGLRFISRKFEGVGLPDDPKPQDAKSAIAAWKAWYQAIRPTAEFLD